MSQLLIKRIDSRRPNDNFSLTFHFSSLITKRHIVFHSTELYIWWTLLRKPAVHICVPEISKAKGWRCTSGSLNEESDVSYSRVSKWTFLNCTSTHLLKALSHTSCWMINSGTLIIFFFKRLLCRRTLYYRKSVWGSGIQNTFS